MNYPVNNYYPYQYQNQFSYNQPQQQVGLNGKIVDSEDVVKATEVPIGGYGVFPKADLSEVFIKTWNNNGTINLIKYKPTIEEETKSNDELNKLLEKMDSLEIKIEELLKPQEQRKELSREEKKKINEF